jgi:hypothetical protein
MLALLTLILVALLGVFLFSALNKKSGATFTEARKELKKRASELESCSVEDFLDNCGLSSEDRSRAQTLFSFMGNMLNVPPEKIAQERVMSDLFILSYNEANQNSSVNIDPFSHDLIEGLAKLSNKSLWEQRWREMPELPGNEDEMADWIMKMKIREFIRFFTPLLEREA